MPGQSRPRPGGGVVRNPRAPSGVSRDRNRPPYESGVAILDEDGNRILDEDDNVIVTE